MVPNSRPKREGADVGSLAFRVNASLRLCFLNRVIALPAGNFSVIFKTMVEVIADVRIKRGLDECVGSGMPCGRGGSAEADEPSPCFLFFQRAAAATLAAEIAAIIATC